MNIALGIDPGRSGAATALNMVRGKKGRGSVVDCLEWKGSTRAGVRGYTVLGEWFQTVSGLMCYILNEWVHEISDEPVAIDGIGVEGMVIPDFLKRRKIGKPISEKAIITLIEETGAVVDAVRAEGHEVGYRPTAVVWRGRVLKLGAYTKRADAEQYALDNVDRVFMPNHGLQSIHEVESGCIAMYVREALITGDL